CPIGEIAATSAGAGIVNNAGNGVGRTAITGCVGYHVDENTDIVDGNTDIPVGSSTPRHRSSQRRELTRNPGDDLVTRAAMRGRSRTLSLRWSTACSQGRVLSGASTVVGSDGRTACTSMRLGLTSSTL